jgi:uncharacterized membrane protein
MTLSRPIVLTIVALALLLVLAANAHLVYVSLTSQPACVAHDRTDDAAAGRFAAAKSAC